MKKSLVVQEIGRSLDEKRAFKVKKLKNTSEWTVGEYLSLDDLNGIMGRSEEEGEVEVTIVGG